MKTIIAIVIAMSLTACGTISGMGKDISGAAELVMTEGSAVVAVPKVTALREPAQLVNSVHALEARVSVAAAFNANIIETGATIPAQEYTQPATIGGRNCPHGKMTAIQGMGKDGKPYKGYFCPAPKGAFDKCKNQYVVVQSPEWNTFVPEQIK